MLLPFALQTGLRQPVPSEIRARHERPMTLRLGRFLRNGYLRRGATIEELAEQLGVDPVGLSGTVAHWNAMCADGRDADFGKGENIYDRSNGDPEHRPNACMAPILLPPFYGVQVYPTSVVTSLGLAADTHARVLDGAGKVMEGLYTCGNDMSSIMGGEYQ